MAPFGKLFGGSKKASKEAYKTLGHHFCDIKIPTDEKFTIYFKKNGGKFIYCEDFSEILEGLTNIISENDWQGRPLYVLDERLKKRFSTKGQQFTNTPNESDIFFTTCEHLIAHDGSILVCSNQINEEKVGELPKNFIVFATTSQLIENISEGLKSIKQRYGKKLPGNITTLKHFNLSDENKNDFLSYGCPSKNIYLLLMEDF